MNLEFFSGILIYKPIDMLNNNLIYFQVICAEREMQELALSFFMHDPDKRLPSLDEVLICQPDTPLEQVVSHVPNPRAGSQSCSHPWSR